MKCIFQINLVLPYIELNHPNLGCGVQTRRSVLGLPVTLGKKALRVMLAYT